MLKFILSLFFVWCVISLGAPETNLTLERSVQIGLSYATSVLKAKNEAELSGREVLESYGRFLPNLVAAGSYGEQSGKNYNTLAAPTVVSTQNYGVTTQITTTLNLFNGFSDYSSLRSSLEKQSASELSLFRAKQQIVIDVTQSFLQVVLDAHLVKIAEDNLKSSRERQTQLKELTRVGARSSADLLRQNAQTAQDESFVYISENKRRDDEILLLRKLNLDVALHYDIVEPPLSGEPGTETALEEKEAIRRALENRADYKAAHATTESAQWNVHSARAGYLPKLDLSAGLFSNGRYFNSQIVGGVDVTPSPQQQPFNQLGDHTNSFVGVTVTWNLFDRLKTNADVERASIQADNARLNENDRHLQVVGEVKEVLGAYKVSLQQLESSRVGLQSAEKAYETVQGRYRVGSSSFVDLLTAQTALVQAQTTRIQSEINYELQKRLVEFYLGITRVHS